MKPIDLGIIGAGAAGIFCAINTAELLPGARIVVFEATQNPLTKVRISGGGRCNVTHHCFDPAQLIKNYPRGARELRSAFSKFQPQDTVEWFAKRGVALKVEGDGRMFPVTDSSQTIIDCLMNEAERLGIKIFKGQKITSAARTETGAFELTSKSGETFNCRLLHLATGSSPEGHRLAEILGHRLTAMAPSLFTFKISDQRLHGFAGISFPQCELALTVDSENKETHQKHKFGGPLLITHWGLSGPAVLKLSAFAAHDLLRAAYRAELKINFIGKSVAAAEEEIQAYANGHPRQQIANHSVFKEIPQRWWTHVCSVVGIGPEHKFSELRANQRSALAKEFCEGLYQVSGKGVFKEEFVTAGGIALTDVDFRTMESKVAPGLFFSGEILDVDGITGGFNFQNAWTTAILAARAISVRLSSSD